MLKEERKGTMMKKYNHKRILGLLLCLAVLMIQLSPVYDLNVYAESKGTITATSLNIRSGPGTSYALVKVKESNAYLKQGETVTLLKKVGDWYLISFTFGGVKGKGYILGTFVKKDTDSSTPTPTPTSKLTCR